MNASRSAVLFLLVLFCSKARSQACNSGQYAAANGTCMECDALCQECTGSATYCTKCPSNLYYEGRKCVETCSANLTANRSDKSYGEKGVCELDLSQITDFLHEETAESFTIHLIIAIAFGSIGYLLLCICIAYCVVKGGKEPVSTQAAEVKQGAGPDSSTDELLDQGPGDEESRSCGKETGSRNKKSMFEQKKTQEGHSSRKNQSSTKSSKVQINKK